MTTSAFGGWLRIPGLTPSKPALVSTPDCRLFLVVRGADDRIYLNVFSGSTWSGWRTIPGSTVDSPAIALLGNVLHIIVRGKSPTTYSLYHGRFDTSSNTWLGWTLMSGSTPSAPDLATDPVGGRIFLAVRGMNNRIYINTWQSTAWVGWNSIPTGSTVQGPAIWYYDEILYAMVVGSSSNNLYFNSMISAIGKWLTWTRIQGASKSVPELSASISGAVPSPQMDLYTLPAAALSPSGGLINRALLVSVSGTQTVTAKPSESLSLNLNYQIWQGTNPYEIDQLMLIASWTPSWPPPSGYYWGIYSDIPPDYPGTSGSVLVQLNAPSNPGTYYLWFVFDPNYGYSEAAADFKTPLTTPAHIKVIVSTTAPPSGGEFPGGTNTIITGQQVVLPAKIDADLYVRRNENCKSLHISIPAYIRRFVTDQDGKLPLTQLWVAYRQPY